MGDRARSVVEHGAGESAGDVSDAGASERVEASFLVANRLGLHARAAAKLVRVANEFTCDVHIARDELEVNAKSIMGVLMLAAAKGTLVRVVAAGADAPAAMAAIGALFDAKFGED